MTFLPMIAIFVVFYFLLIRPQQKRAKETQAMLDALQKGDEVVTAGGLVGKIAQADRPVRRGRDRAERRDQRAARGHLATAAQGHDQGAVTRRPGRRRCTPPATLRIRTAPLPPPDTRAAPTLSGRMP